MANKTLKLAAVDCVLNVIAHAQKPDFFFRQNGRVHLNRLGRQFSRLLRISGSNAGYTMFRGSVKGTGYSLHSQVTPSLPIPCVTVCHHISTGVYIQLKRVDLDSRQTGISASATRHTVTRGDLSEFATRDVR